MNIKRKGLMLILDGIGDHQIAILNGKTPLEAAATPNMDRLIGQGQGGLVDPLYPGVSVGTHTGTGLLLGIPPSEIIMLARGPVEALGAGVESSEGDLLIRSNFATLKQDQAGFQIIDRRAGRIDEEARELALLLKDIDLGDGLFATLHPATQHRGVLHLRGGKLSAAITDTDPGGHTKGQRLLPCEPLGADEASINTARALNRFTALAFKRLHGTRINQMRQQSGLPAANGIIYRSAGIRYQPVNLMAQLGLSACLVAGERTVIGLGKLLDFKICSDPRFTSLPDTDLNAKVKAAARALQEHDIVFLHVKGPDICAHDMDPQGKKEVIEAVDRSLAPLLSDDLVIGVTGDHSTDCNTGNHVGDPVPSLLYTAGCRGDNCSQYGERECAMGGLGRITATSFLYSMLDAMGLMPKYRLVEVALQHHFHAQK